MKHHKIDYKVATSEQIEADIGRKLDAMRLERNLTQESLGQESGTSRSTIARLGTPGKGISVDSLIRIMQSLGIVEQLQHIVPEREISPIAQLEEAEHVRQRARKSNHDPEPWGWEDKP